MRVRLLLVLVVSVAANVSTASAQTALQTVEVGKEYDDLVALGRCDWADRYADCGSGSESSKGLVSRVRSYLSKVVGAPNLGTEQEAAVVFVGVGATNRIVLLRGDSSPHYRTLGDSKYFWGVFVEDVGTAFDTSIDVRFSSHTTDAESDEFDPAGIVAPKPSQQVRVGAKRFRVRTPPVNIQVGFTRQGPAYGVRQWVREYRVYGWHGVGVVGGVMVPGRTLPLHEFRTDPVLGPGGSAPTQASLGNDDSSYRVFAVAGITWPRARDAALESGSTWLGFLKALRAPEPQVGIGVPSAPFSTLYGGLSWPLRYSSLRFSAGVTMIRQEILADGHYVGQLVPLELQAESLIDHVWQAKFTVGLSIDLVGR
jgi:hypothetical protein